MANNNENKILNVPHLRFPEFIYTLQKFTYFLLLIYIWNINNDLTKPILTNIEMLSTGSFNDYSFSGCWRG